MDVIGLGVLELLTLSLRLDQLLVQEVSFALVVARELQFAVILHDLADRVPPNVDVLGHLGLVLGPNAQNLLLRRDWTPLRIQVDFFTLIVATSVSKVRVPSTDRGLGLNVLTAISLLWY